MAKYFFHRGKKHKIIRVVFSCSLVLFNDISVIFVRQVFMNCPLERCSIFQLRLFAYFYRFVSGTNEDDNDEEKKYLKKKIDLRVWVNNSICYDICGVWHYGLVLRCKMVNTRLFFSPSQSLPLSLSHTHSLSSASLSLQSNCLVFSLTFNWTFTINTLRSDLFQSQRLERYSLV